MTYLARLAAATICVSALSAQRANYDEGKVPSFRLPDPLTAADDSRLTAEQWTTRRRGEILELFKQHMYGRVPEHAIKLKFELHEQDESAMSGRAIRKQVRIHCQSENGEKVLDLLLYLPSKQVSARGSVPVFLGLNFGGNQTIRANPKIELAKSWVSKRKVWGNKHYEATEISRGKSARRWPMEMALKRGYGVATMYYGDIDPDFDDQFKNGVHAMFGENQDAKRAPDAWGSIATWAWGLSRALDYLESDAQVDAKRVAVIGHSRLGKASLWAGAVDPRFAMVVSNNSGCGGAAYGVAARGE